jgi:type III secretion protein C
VDFESVGGQGMNLTTIYKHGMDVFMARVHALESDGDASVLSRPAVLTMDNTQASLEVTQTYYISVAGQEEVDLFDVTYGTILRVTPHIIADEETGRKVIMLTVRVEDGGSTPAASSSGTPYPTVSKNLVNTQAIVGDGEALILGGHYYETNTATDSGIPLLKDIPLLGMFFKDQSDVYRKQERLFVISPRIVDQSALLTQTGDYSELMDRTMMQPPVTRVERTTGGCARTRRVAVSPAPIPSPTPVPMLQNGPVPVQFPDTPAPQIPVAPKAAPQANPAQPAGTPATSPPRQTAPPAAVRTPAAPAPRPAAAPAALKPAAAPAAALPKVSPATAMPPQQTAPAGSKTPPRNAKPAGQHAPAPQVSPITINMGAS